LKYETSNCTEYSCLEITVGPRPNPTPSDPNQFRVSESSQMRSDGPRSQGLGSDMV